MVYDVLLLYRDRWDFFLRLAAQHVCIAGTASLIAAIIGLACGMYICERQKAVPYVLGLTNVVYTIPSISLLGFLLPFSGIGNLTAIIALTVYALLPMVHNTYTGLRSIDPAILEAARGMGSTRMQMLLLIKLPLALPVILTGVRNMVLMTIALTGIASFIGAGGLGVAIYRGITTNNQAMTVAGSLLIALMAFAGDQVFGRLEKAVRRRRGMHEE